jgi:hypothetical protein
MRYRTVSEKAATLETEPPVNSVARMPVIAVARLRKEIR